MKIPAELENIIMEYVDSILLYERKMLVHRELHTFFCLRLVHRIFTIYLGTLT